MNDTNRAAAIVVSVVLILVALFIILLTWMAPDQSIDSIADLAGWLEDNNEPATQLLITFAALIIALLGATIIILELMPEASGSVKVAKVGVGDARIGTDEVSRQVESELRSVSRLKSAEVRVASRGSRADLHLDLLVDSEGDVVETASIAIQRAREVVEGRMGVELERPPRAEVHFHDQRSMKKMDLPATNSQPVGAGAPTPQASAQPSTSSDQPVSNSEPIHEVTSTVREDSSAGG